MWRKTLSRTEAVLLGSVVAACVFAILEVVDMIARLIVFGMN